ncbi:MAG TPA: tetratricopeptide repeat protein [Bacteroidia bacterium]|jgi:tetratricopeptide (TPR) repeat protein
MGNKNRYLFKLSVFACVLMFFSACKTNKNTFMHRGWHNMTARYNGYFYSNENIKESVKKVEKANRDDFSKMIPLFVYTNNTTSKNYYADFDKTIKKSSVVIQRHTITEKKSKKEIPNACKWIDENYILIGKAHFYKRDLFSALEAFEYVSKIYPNPKAKYLGMLWMIRTNNEIGSYSLSEATIDEIRNAKDFPTDRIYQQELAAVTADYYIKRGDYTPSIKYLTKAIALTRKKATKARYTYVLAQVYEKLGDNQKASQYYGMVPGLHPTYDMAFNAQINRAKLYDISAGGSKIIKKQLLRMLKDDKNIEFQDQIYYALADIAHKEKDIPLAMEYLRKSIKASVSNNTQKSLSYLKRADIYFEKPDYKNAQANYDSTMTFLPKDYAGYKEIEEKKNSLTALVTNLNVITMEDSLQRLGRLSEKDRNSKIDKIIVQIEEEERLKEEERQNQQNNQATLNQAPTDNNTTAGGSSAWYFYNPATVSFGVGAFTKKWGSRKLEDNWRRSEKDVVIANSQAEDSEDPSDTAQTVNGGKPVAGNSKNKKDRNYYLKNIPLTPEAIAKSNGKIVEAYYNVGSIYKEQLANNQKSVETFEELLKRYPENKYKLTSYYQLYRIYLVMNNAPKAEYYKNILLKEYPDSDYAAIIRNPGVAGDIAASKSQVEKFYTETYQLYAEGKYHEAYANCSKADSMYSKSSLMPQFAFLKALAIGRTQDINEFEKALTQVIVKYPKEPVKEKAQEMLDAIKKQKSPPAEVTVTDTATSPKDKTKFVFKEDGPYYCLIVVENGKGDLNKFKTKLSDFNAEKFSTSDIDISSVFLDLTHQLVSVKTFDGKARAMDYFNIMISQKDLFSALEIGSYHTFVISAENYTIFYKDKNIAEYEQFFTQNY